MRSIAAGKNVPEKKPTKGAARLGFFGGRAAYWRRSRYSPVMRRCAVPLVMLLRLLFLSNYFEYILVKLCVYILQ
jgi:hypothetical protein